MEVALYLPGGGYYEGHVEIGPAGDFLTSPETHPIFGALLARLALQMWRALESPRRFAVVEYGAGTGSLCRQILETAPQLDADFASALDYWIVERSAFLRAMQQAKLPDLLARVRWDDPSDGVEPADGCVLANEVVDALPVHRLAVESEGLRELHVGLAADRYLELRGPLSRPELQAYLSASGVPPPEGSVVEINLAARDWLRDVSGRLRRGYVIAIDFGGETGEILRSATPRGGLKCFYRHGWTEDPFDRPGLQDLTAPVDFTFLRAVGEELGLVPSAAVPQGKMLVALGLREALARLDADDLRAEERQRNRNAIEALGAPGALGGHRVLIQRKQAPEVRAEMTEGREEIRFPLSPRAAMAWPE